MPGELAQGASTDQGPSCALRLPAGRQQQRQDAGRGRCWLPKPHLRCCPLLTLLHKPSVLSP